jgi:hypothetical protein
MDQLTDVPKGESGPERRLTTVAPLARVLDPLSVGKYPERPIKHLESYGRFTRTTSRRHRACRISCCDE